MEKISKLAQLFTKYNIYPRSCYKPNSAATIFRNKFSDDHYSKHLKVFFSCQKCKSTQRGADLSWWGEYFFSGKQDCRVMIIGQDTAADNAGNIVLEAQYFSNQFDKVIDEIKSDKKHRKQLLEEKLGVAININRRDIITKQFSDGYMTKEGNFFDGWKLNFDFLYLTDALKVFRSDSEKIDEEKSKELLEAEIEFCDPDLIIFLGQPPFDLLNENNKFGEYNSAVESGKTILIKGKKCVVAPFFVGNGYYWAYKYKEGLRMKIATKLIRDLVL